jgi:hypothetical protein
VRREATGPTAPGWRVDCGGGPDAAGAWEVGRPDVTPRAKREARRWKRAGVPSPCAGGLGARRTALEPRRPEGRWEAGQPALRGGGEAPEAPGVPASCRCGDGRRGWGAVGGVGGGEGVAWRGRRDSPVGAGGLGHSPKLTSWGKADQLGGAGARARLTLSRGQFSTHPNSPVHGGIFRHTQSDQLVGAPGAAHPLLRPLRP